MISRYLPKFSHVGALIGISLLGSPADATLTCDLTDCSGTVALLGGAAIGGNTTLSAGTTASGASTGVASVGAAASTTGTTTSGIFPTMPYNAMVPPSMPTAPAAAFADPRTSATYYTLPTVSNNLNGSVTSASFPTTLSGTTTFNPTANQPSAPFDDPVNTRSYYTPPTTTSTSSSNGGTSVTGSGNSASTQGLSSLP